MRQELLFQEVTYTFGKEKQPSAALAARFVASSILPQNFVSAYTLGGGKR